MGGCLSLKRRKKPSANVEQVEPKPEYSTIAPFDPFFGTMRELLDRVENVAISRGEREDVRVMREAVSHLIPDHFILNLMNRVRLEVLIGKDWDEYRHAVIWAFDYAYPLIDSREEMRVAIRSRPRREILGTCAIHPRPQGESCAIHPRPQGETCAIHPRPQGEIPGALSVNALVLQRTGTTIRVLKEGIQHQGGPDTVIVNAANDRLALGTGVAAAIKTACGFTPLQKECDLFLGDMARDLKMATVPVGSLAITGTYKMSPTTAILHAVAPACSVPNRPGPDQPEQLRSAYDSVMHASEKLGTKIVVVPFLGAGVFQYPAKESAELGILSALANCPSTTIEEIRFVCITDSMRMLVEGLLGGASVVINNAADVQAIHARISARSRSITGSPANMAAIQQCLQYALNVNQWHARIARVITAAPTARATRQPATRVTPAAPRRGQSTIVAPSPIAKRRITPPNPPRPAKRGRPSSAQSQAVPAQPVPRAPRSLASQERSQRMSLQPAEVLAANREKNADRERLRRLAQSDLARDKELEQQRQRMAAERVKKSTEQAEQRRQRESQRIAASRAEATARREADNVRRARATQEDGVRMSQDIRLRMTAEEELEEIMRNSEEARIAAAAAEGRAERAARRDETQREEGIEQRREADGNQHPIVDILDKNRSRIDPEQTEEENQARLARNKLYQFKDVNNRHRPLRKPHSRFITEAQKDYRKCLPPQHDMGKMPMCRYCRGLNFKGVCCSGGRVHVRLPLQPPEFHRRLLRGTFAQEKKFQKNLLQYNRAFQFASMSCEREFVRKSNPFIKINGNIHFQIGGLRAPTDKQPLFGQIYLFDPEAATNLRLTNPVGRTPFDKEIMLHFTKWFDKNNALASIFKTVAKGVEEEQAKGNRMGDVMFVVRAPTSKELQGRHPGTLSRPYKEIPSFIYKTDDTGAPPPKGLWVQYQQGGHMRELAYYDPNTEPALYPLLFPYGEKGFQSGEEKLFPQGTTRVNAGFSLEDDAWEQPDAPDSLEEESEDGENEELEGAVAEETNNEQMADADDDADSVASEGEDERLENPTEQPMHPRIQPPVDFENISNPDLSDQQRDVYDDSDREDGEPAEVEGAEDDEAIINDPIQPVVVEEPDDEPQYVQEDVGNDEGPRTLTAMEKKRLHASRRQWALYVLQERFNYGDHVNYGLRVNLLGGISHLLSQLFLIDQWLKIVRSRNDFIRKSFAEFRGSTVRDLTLAYEMLQKKAVKMGMNAGYCFRLPKAYPQSVAWYRDQSDKGMVLMHQIGKPDAFVTMTGNYDWPEIKDNLVGNGTWQSNALLVCTVFYAKCQELLDDIVNKELFGPVVGFVYSIEFQKRGMPHMHLLVILKEGHKLDREHLIEKHVYARFPEVDVLSANPTEEEKETIKMQKELRKKVKNLMVHNPCKHHRTAYCQQHPNRDPNVVYSRCTKHFPKPQSDFTRIMPDGTVIYFRPEKIMEMGKNSEGNPTEIFDEWIVTYNPYLLSKYGSHINVEVVSASHVFKYLFKYIFKGYDCALMEVYEQMDNSGDIPDGINGMTVNAQGALLPDGAGKDSRKAKDAAKRMQEQAKRMGVENSGQMMVNYDEAIIKETFRQMTACEAAWGILGFPLAGRSHKVKLLSVHEPGAQPIVFKKGGEMDAIRQIEAGQVVSQLDAYFKLMRSWAKAKEYREKSKAKKNTAPTVSQSPAMPAFVPASNLPVAPAVSQMPTQSVATAISQAESVATAVSQTQASESPIPPLPPSPAPSSVTPDWGADDYGSDVEMDEVLHELLQSYDGIDRSNGPTFEDIARTYRFDSEKGVWVKYKKQPRLLVHIRAVNVRRTELFAIRLIVKNVGGLTSFEDARTVDGVLYDTFLDAAYARGLMNSQKEYEDLLRDAITRETPYVVRRMFVDCIVFGGLLHPEDIWGGPNNEFRHGMMDAKFAYPYDVQKRKAGLAHALFHIQCLLKRYGYTLQQLNLPLPNTGILSAADRDNAMDIPRVPDYSTTDTPTEEQQNIVDLVVNAVVDGIPRRIFVEASGGCGKTFVYKVIYDTLRRLNNNYRVTCVASTGIASILLPHGSTAHRQFFIPLNVDEDKLSTMTMESDTAEWLRGTHLIIFDEATMADKWVFNCIDVLLRNIMRNDLPFGGKSVLLGGDWKQLLPVVTSRTAEMACNVTLLGSPLWKEFEVMTLEKNMRASKDPEFAQFLENTGRGLFDKGDGKPVPCSYVKIDKPGVMMPSQGVVLQSMYEGKLDDEDYLYRTAVLCTTNKHAEHVNSIVLSHVPGVERVYRAIDTPSEGVRNQIPPEFFSTMMESGMPPYELHLKVGAMVILLRNMDLSGGLCNGTRLIVHAMYDHYIIVKHLDSRWKGELRCIMRKDLEPAETMNQKPLYSRNQFPLRLAYCLTINKSQGQTFDRVGLLLQRNVFAHGQLYVALSRVHTFSDLKIYSRAEKDGQVVLANEVSRSVIEDMDRAIAASRAANPIAPRPPTTQRSHPPSPAASQQPQVPPVQVLPPQNDLITRILEQSRRARGIGPVTPLPPIEEEDVPTIPTVPQPNQAPVTAVPSRRSMIVTNQKKPRSKQTTLSIPNQTPVVTSTPRKVPQAASVLERPDGIAHAPPDSWLLPSNGGTDCFLNTAIQFMRRMTDLLPSINDWRPQPGDEADAQRFLQLRELANVLSMNGNMNPTEYREFLNITLEGLQPDFLTAQQDAGEMVTKILRDIVPEEITAGYKVECSRSKRCIDSEQCQKPPNVESEGPITYNIHEMNQIVDLEADYSSQWTTTDNEGRHHCEDDCVCCMNPPPNHDSEHCNGCTNANTPFREQIRYRLQGQSEYAIFNFNIRDEIQRKDWTLSENCDLDGLTMMGQSWQAVALIRHYGGVNGGHYVCITRERDGLWWKHDDAREPYVVTFDKRNMRGVNAILFKKI